ncbi:cytoplasmic dynein 2 intermediate chain 1 [Lepeophtheirus salmonis]|uniref:cytoplasmic dynein 2 intermediate chain 1 n=1 Tax=Lepeophtheirus salmonis TaxID=72036 RepID=UPI001AE99EB5|nr:cytoplasmic dynein 2 intermediate chain 1-like [Lepeophtheirus salmonis]
MIYLIIIGTKLQRTTPRITDHSKEKRKCMKKNSSKRKEVKLMLNQLGIHPNLELKSSHYQRVEKNTVKGDRVHESSSSKEAKPSRKSEIVTIEKSPQIQASIITKDETEIAEEIVPDKDSLSGDIEYEDDFEDYEEDFESDDEDGDMGEEELVMIDKKMDSGNFDVTPRFLKEIAEVKNAIMEENCATKKPKHPVPEETPHTDLTQSPDRSQTLVFNFDAAKKRKKEIDKSSKTKKRGRELLSMIRLDTVTIDILNIPPISYEKFMTTFGKGRQAIVQTGEDIFDKGVQCDGIESLNKWTQFPPSTKFDADLPIQSIIKGVGGEGQKEDERETFLNSIDYTRLDTLITSGGKVILTLMQEKESQFFDKTNNHLNQSATDFSSNIISLPISNYPYLKHIISVKFALHQPYLLITCHYDLESKSSYLAIWDLNAPKDSPPQKLLTVRGLVTTFCIYNYKTSLIFAGLSNGIIVLWDLKEEIGLHSKRENELASLRSPTYIDEKSHESSITEIITLLDESNSEPNSFQIVSIEEQSKLIIWTVLEENYNKEEFLGLAYWGSIRLVPSTTLNYNEKLLFLDVCSDKDGSKLFVATDSGQILHFYRRDAGFRRPTPSVFKSEIEGLSASCNKVIYSAFESYKLLYAGFDDGYVRVYNITNEKPILVWPAATQGSPLLELKLSFFRPSIFFIIDSDSNIVAWNLLNNTTSPVCSLKNTTAVSMDLNQGQDKEYKSLMAVGLANGNVDIHTLKEEFTSNNKNEMEMFSQFIFLLL